MEEISCSLYTASTTTWTHRKFSFTFRDYEEDDLSEKIDNEDNESEKDEMDEAERGEVEKFIEGAVVDHKGLTDKYNKKLLEIGDVQISIEPREETKIRMLKKIPKIQFGESEETSDDVKFDDPNIIMNEMLKNMTEDEIKRRLGISTDNFDSFSNSKLNYLIQIDSQPSDELNFPKDMLDFIRSFLGRSYNCRCS
jgi:hypothetical protein